MWLNDYKLLGDESASLAFRKVFHVPVKKEVHEMDIKDLRKVRTATANALRTRLDFVESEKREFNEEEDRAFEYGNQLVNAINDEINLRTELGSVDPLDPEDHKGSRTTVTRMPENITDTATDRSKDFRSYEGMFPHISLSSGGFKGHTVEERLRAFMTSVLSGRADSRLLDHEQEFRLHNETIGTDGGWAVPSEMSAMMLNKSLLQAEIVRPRATVIPMKGPSIEVPAFDDSDEQNGQLFGGFNVAYLSEGGTATRTYSKLRNMTFSAKKIALYTDFTNELLQDQSQFSQWVSNKMIGAIGAVQDYNYINGNGGAGRPLGLINCPNRILHSRSGANAVSLSDLQTMVSRLHPAFHSKGIWIISTGARVQVMGISDSAGHLVYTQSPQSIVAGLPATIYGFPVIWSTRSPALGSDGDVILTDLSAYGVGINNAMRVESTQAAQWTEDKTDLRVIMRLDGQSLYQKAITPASGGETMSSIVVLGS